MYADLIGKENIREDYLAVLSPRRKASTWVLNSGSVWRQTFDYGYVTALAVEGVTLAVGTSSVLSAGTFYLDPVAKILYVRLSDSSNPNLKFIVVTYELYVGTVSANWHRDPLDETSRPAFFDPIIKQSPVAKETTSDLLFGFAPTQSSDMILSNGEHTLEHHVYDSSFKGASIRLYHWLRVAGTFSDPDSDDMKLVYDGVMGELKYDDKTGLTITTYDRVDQFSQDFTPKTQSVFSASDFPNCDPNMLLQAIRYVYGLVDGFVPVNIDFNDTAPSTSNNREFVVNEEQVNLATISRLVPSSPSSTTTRTYLASAQGFTIGDSVWFDRAAGTDEYKVITNVNYASNYVEHAALVSPMASGDHLKRSFVGFVKIVQNSVAFTALYGRDYTERPAQAAGCSGFKFTASMEANLGMTTLQPTDRVFCRAYGRTNDVGFGGNDAQTGNMTNAIAILYDLLVNFLGITQVNTAAFTALAATVTDALGFALPAQSTGSAPMYKDIFIKILNSVLCKLHLDSSNDWTVSQVKPITSQDTQVGNDEIAAGSFKYEFDYRDLVSDVFVDYNAQEQSESDTGIQVSSTVHSISDTARLLHGINKQSTYQSYHFRAVDAQRMADRLAFVFGDRRGLVSMQVTARFFQTLINDKIDLQRERLPGFPFVEETLRSRRMAVVELERSLKNVNITMDDQLGIQNNSGSW